MEFVPTYLYIKQHMVTGLKYFGKTTYDPHTYKGSGLYWKRHLDKHGGDVTTVWAELFTDKAQLVEYALKFSVDNDIVASAEWANLIAENGLDGAPVGHEGHKFTAEQVAEMSRTTTERWVDDDYRTKVVQAQIDRWANNPELKERQSKRLKEEFWTDARKESHSQLMKLQATDAKRVALSMRMKGIAKSEDHRQRISEALKGTVKSPEQLRRMAIGRQKIKGAFVDHTGSVYEVHNDFLKPNGLSAYFFTRLNSPVTEAWCSKLGVDYASVAGKTWHDLGFGFTQQI